MPRDAHAGRRSRRRSPPGAKTKMPSEVGGSPSHRVRVLDVEAIEVAVVGDGVVLEVADDDAFDGHGGAHQGRRGPLPCTLVDRRERIAADFGWHDDLTHVRYARGGRELRIGVGVARAAGAVRAALDWSRCPVAGAVFVHLRLAGVQQHQQPGVVGIVGVVDDGVDEIGCRDRRVVREVGGVAGVERDRVGAVLQTVRGRT